MRSQDDAWAGRLLFNPGCLLAACSGLLRFSIIHWFRTPGVSWRFLFACLFVLGGLFGVFFYRFHLWDLVFSPVTGLFYIKRDFSATLNLYTLNLLTQYSWTKEVILNIFHLFLQQEDETAIKYLF